MPAEANERRHDGDDEAHHRDGRNGDQVVATENPQAWQGKAGASRFEVLVDEESRGRRGEYWQPEAGHASSEHAHIAIFDAQLPTPNYRRLSS